MQERGREKHREPAAYIPQPLWMCCMSGTGRAIGQYERRRQKVADAFDVLELEFTSRLPSLD